jgi:hypothetical protein
MPLPSIKAASKVSRTFATGTDKKLASMLSATTSPRAIWCSQGEYMVPGSGQSVTDQFGASRVRARIAGGKWLAIAPIFVGAYYTLFKSPFGVTSTPSYTVAFNLELANGTQTYSYQSPNTGGTILSGTFNGVTDGVVRAGDVLVGDWIFASDASLPYFQWTDRTLIPWIRCAYSKTAGNDNIGAVYSGGSGNNTSYNAPRNEHWATCTSYANAKTLINTVAISNYNGGNDKWGAGGSASLPSCMGFIGIGLDGQKSVMWFGTSICDGDGQATHSAGGVDPANETPACYDLLGYPCAWAQKLSRSTPCLNLAVGASAMYVDWSNVAGDISWSTNQSISLSRRISAQLAGYFDVIVAHDVHNESGSEAYTTTIKHFVDAMRVANPQAKIISCKVPNGYVDINGTNQPYSTGLDTNWNNQLALVTSGYFDAQISVRDTGVDQYPDLGTQVSGTTTSNGSTTTLNDSGATWLVNQWANSWVQVGGVKRMISSNTRTQLTFAAFASAVNTATAYLILGNTSGDGLHPNMVGQIRMGDNFDTAIQTIINIPKFVSTT